MSSALIIKIHKCSLNLTTGDNLLAVSVYVAYLSNRHVETTVKDVLKDFQHKHRRQPAGGLDGRSMSAGRIVTKRTRFCNDTFCDFKHSVQLNIDFVWNMMYQNCTLYVTL